MSQTQTFLIIEDQESIAGLLKSELAKLTDLSITICPTLQAAKSLIESGQPISVCLTGLQLPDAHENESVHLLKAHHIPTVVLTASFKESTRQEMFRLKVADYVIKENIASIRYAVQVTHRLYQNAQREVWVLGTGDKSSARLLGLLRTHRYQVRAYDSTRVLWQDLAQRHPHLLVLDGTSQAPGNETFELINQLRQRYLPGQLPMIACESTAHISNAIKLMKYGVNDFYNTCFTPEEFYVRVHQNIEQSEIYHQIERLSQRDGLTDLYNRRTLFAKAETTLQQAQKDHQACFALMADIDHFKQVNDRYGHHVGDQAIVMTARVLAQTFESAWVGRFGGEEFCVIGHQTSPQAVKALAETVRQTIEQDSVSLVQTGFSLSLGVAFAIDSVEAGVAQADKALYEAKHQGRNRIEVFDHK